MVVSGHAAYFLALHGGGSGVVKSCATTVKLDHLAIAFSFSCLGAERGGAPGQEVAEGVGRGAGRAINYPLRLKQWTKAGKLGSGRCFDPLGAALSCILKSSKTGCSSSVSDILQLDPFHASCVKNCENWALTRPTAFRCGQ